MNAEQIKAALKEKSLTFSMIGDAIDLPPAVISATARRAARSQKAAEAIAKAIGKPMSEVFPDYGTVKRLKGKAREKKVEELRQILSA